MQKFIFRTIAFALFAGGLGLAIYLLPYRNDNYLHALRLKNELLERTKNPRLIIVGGSNTAFGLDSQMLQDALPYAVVNMGLHGSLGYDFQIHEVLDKIRKEDVVVLIPEYDNYFRSYYLNKETLLQASEYYPKALLNLHQENRVEWLFDHFVFRLKRNMNELIYRIIIFVANKEYRYKDYFTYSLKGINEFGDQTAHLGYGANQKLRGTRMPKDSTKLVTQNFHELSVKMIAKCRQLHASVFFAFPPQPMGEYNTALGRHILQQFQDRNYPLLSSPAQTVFPADHFWDSIYHLNEEGRAKRTQALIDQLQQAINQ